MSIEIGGVAHELNEQARQVENSGAELARQARERRGQKANGDVHAVKRTRSASRIREAADSKVVDRGPVRRWQPAYALPALPNPPGYVLCYITRHNQHRGDEAGLIAALQEGWEFARKEDFPGHILPTQRLTDHGSVIGNDSTVLMKLPDELKAQRDAHYNDRRDTATRAVMRPKPGLQEATSQMPLVEDRNDHRTTMDPVRVRRRSVGQN